MQCVLNGEKSFHKFPKNIKKNVVPKVSLCLKMLKIFQNISTSFRIAFEPQMSQYMQNIQAVLDRIRFIHNVALALKI